MKNYFPSGNNLSGNMLNMIKTSSSANAEKFSIEDFFTKKIHLCQVDSFIEAKDTLSFLNELKFHRIDSPHNVRMNDGYFYPYPYSTIHDQSVFNGSHPYFESNVDFSGRHSSFTDLLQKKLEAFLQVELHPLVKDQSLKFSKFNTRILYHQKNGIDIHCENAFIEQLNSSMSSWMEEIIDLRNALSFFLVLQQPENGGELILFNQEWDDVQIAIRHESYEDRHDISGAMFSKRGIRDIEHKKILPQQNSAVIFRAAQIWHGIHKIEGKTERVTVGCFIARGRDGKYYFWA